MYSLAQALTPPFSKKRSCGARSRIRGVNIERCCRRVFQSICRMKDKTRNTLSDLTWSWSMWTRTAAPINDDVAHAAPINHDVAHAAPINEDVALAFEHAPVLKDDARKGRLPWAFK